MAGAAATTRHVSLLGCKTDRGRRILSRPVSHESAAPPTVLAVDDDPVVRDCPGIVLNEHCELVFAGDGVEAVETLRCRSVDVVLLDLRMPRMSGHEALMHMRRDHPRTPVIVLTAIADVPTAAAAMKQGAWDYVTKPWDDDVLITLVHRAARDGREETGVLLVSESVASFAPLQLALEPQTRVITTSIAHARRCPFLPSAIVIESPSSRVTEALVELQSRFPKSPVITTGNESASLARDDRLRVDAVVESGSVEGIMAELVRFRAMSQATMLHEPVSAAVKFMVAHYEDSLTVSEIANAVNLSEGRLAHIFRETTGFSLKDYMTRLRVSIARRLLTETTDTLDTIATKMGYADVSNFSRRFKCIDGMSPGQYRRNKCV
jgi:YesN/AraC family two-component response regulator